jgi:hypothetical protein
VRLIERQELFVALIELPGAEGNLMGKWLTQLWKPEDAPFNYWLELYRFTVGQNCVESQELFIAWVT